MQKPQRKTGHPERHLFLLQFLQNRLVPDQQFLRLLFHRNRRGPFFEQEFLAQQQARQNGRHLRQQVGQRCKMEYQRPQEGNQADD